MAQTEQGTTTQQRNQQLERGEAAQRKADIRLQKGFLQSCWLNRPGEGPDSPGSCCNQHQCR